MRKFIAGFSVSTFVAFVVYNAVDKRFDLSGKLARAVGL